MISREYIVWLCWDSAPYNTQRWVWSSRWGHRVRYRMEMLPSSHILDGKTSMNTNETVRESASSQRRWKKLQKYDWWLLILSFFLSVCSIVFSAFSPVKIGFEQSRIDIKHKSDTRCWLIAYNDTFCYPVSSLIYRYVVYLLVQQDLAIKSSATFGTRFI